MAFTLQVHTGVCQARTADAMVSHASPPSTQVGRRPAPRCKGSLETQSVTRLLMQHRGTLARFTQALMQ